MTEKRGLTEDKMTDVREMFSCETAILFHAPMPDYL